MPEPLKLYTRTLRRLAAIQLSNPNLEIRHSIVMAPLCPHTFPALAGGPFVPRWV
jgi:hypothetical protein